MNYDMSSYFEDPEFKEALARYEGMVENQPFPPLILKLMN